MTKKNFETKNELYTRIQHKQSKQEFEKNINKIKQDFGDLIDEDAAAYLLVDKLGCNKANVVELADIHPGQEATVQGIITSITPPHTFTKKNGKQGKVSNLIITDETGSLPIVLWNDDVNKIETGEIRPHMKMKIINGYTKQGRNGVELHVGRWSSMSIDATKQSTTAQLKGKNHRLGTKNEEKIKGTVLSISPTNVFFKKDESYGFVSKVHLKTTTGIQRITVWDDQVKNLQQFNQGDTVEFSYLDVKVTNGTKEYHANGKAIISLC